MYSFRLVRFSCALTTNGIASPSGPKVSGGLVAVVVAIIVAFGVILFVTIRWCVRAYRSEGRELVEPGVSLEDGANERLVENTHHHSVLSKRSSVAPSIYEGSYANAELDGFVTIAHPTRLPRSSDGEELGLLAASPSTSNTHSTVSSHSPSEILPYRKPSGPRNPPKIFRAMSTGPYAVVPLNDHNG